MPDGEAEPSWEASAGREHNSSAVLGTTLTMPRAALRWLWRVFHTHEALHMTVTA